MRGRYLAAVVGLGLVDGREVIVRIRPRSPRLVACVQTQAHLFAAGFPCPEPLTGVVDFDDSWVASAERFIAGGALLPSSGRAAGPFAESSARLVRLSPPAAGSSTLEPRLSWTAWRHAEQGVWPRPEDHVVDLNAVDGPRWVDEIRRSARDRLGAGRAAGEVIAHGDWYSGNLRWTGTDLLVVYDCDSVIADTEAALVGSPPPCTRPCMLAAR
jgi:hypothetical protein